MTKSCHCPVRGSQNRLLMASRLRYQGTAISTCAWQQAGSLGGCSVLRMLQQPGAMLGTAHVH